MNNFRVKRMALSISVFSNEHSALRFPYVCGMASRKRVEIRVWSKGEQKVSFQFPVGFTI